MKVEKLITDNSMEEGEDHFSNNAQTPLKKNAFEKSDDEKITRLVNYLSRIFSAIIDTQDDYKKYNYIKIPSDIKIYNIEVSEDIKNKLIILGYKECYNYINKL